MGVELVGDKDPSRLGIGLDSLGDVGREVSFGACGYNAGCHDLSGGYIQIGDQRLGAMALVFEFLRSTWPGCIGKQGWRRSKAWMPVISSVLLTCVPAAARAGVAS